MTSLTGEMSITVAFSMLEQKVEDVPLVWVSCLVLSKTCPAQGVSLTLSPGIKWQNRARSWCKILAFTSTWFDDEISHCCY